MRTLVIVLVLANAAAFGWQYTRSVRSATRAIVERPAAREDAPPLVLLRELDELPPTRSSQAPPDATPAVQSDIKADVEAADACIDVGPFADVAARDALGEWMQDFVAASYTRSVTSRGDQFFWVYLEPTSSAESARQNIAELADSGVEDYMLISRGDLKNAISLGLFRSQDSVNRRLAELSEKGYKPVVVPRFEEHEQYFIAMQFAVRSGQPPDIPAGLLGTAMVSELDCASLPARAGATPVDEAAAGPLVEGLTD